MGKVTKVFTAIILILTVFFAYEMIGHAEQLYYNGGWHDYNAKPIYLKINGQSVSTSMPPIVFGESTLVPAREVFEVLGAKVDWYDAQKIIKITGNNINISLKIDSNAALVNGVSKQLDVPAMLINDKTMIPIRFVSEQLGYKVDWSDTDRVITITTGQNTSNNQINTNNTQNQTDSSILQNQANSNSVQSQTDVNITNISFIDSNQNSGTSQVSTGTKTVQIDIKGDMPLDKYTTMNLTGPDRFVIDIDNSLLAVSTKTVSVDKYGIDQIRSGQYTTNPNVTRIVVDMQKPLNYEIAKSDDKKDLLINLLVNTAYTNAVLTQPSKKDKYVVVIDPGHGGSDPGAIYNDMTEKELNLDIALKLKKLLLKDNIDVRLTREDDSYVDLYARTDFANSAGADLFLSIHNNAMDDQSYDGTMTLFNPNDDDGGFTNRKFAQIIQDEVTSQAGTTDRGIRERPHLAVLRTSEVYKIPAVLVEVAFMTNQKDADNLKTDTFQEKVAKALRNGIIKALDEKRSTST